MTQNEIIAMAKEAGAAIGKPTPTAPEIIFTQSLDIRLFAKLVAAKAIAEQDGDCQRCKGKGCVACDAREQEPDKYAMDIECTKCGAKQSGILTVNTHPQPKREWVGLTDEEIQTVVNKVASGEYQYSDTFARAIEAKLKEKNGIKGEA